MGPGLLILCYGLLACGPLLVVSLPLLRRPFLVILLFASAFYWLLCYFVICLFGRGMVPVSDSIWRASIMLLLSVGMQEAGRWGLSRANTKLVILLEQHGHNGTEQRLSATDKCSMYLTHGTAHAAMMAAVCYISWLSLLSGGGTYFAPACTAMSWFQAGGLVVLGSTMFLAAAAVVAMDAYARRKRRTVQAVAAAHLVLALQLLVGYIHNGCISSVVVSLLLGGAMGVAALQVGWQSCAHVAPENM